MTEDLNALDEMNQELQYLTSQFNEDEHLGSDNEADGDEEADLALITASYEEDAYGDDSVNDSEDDDFYDLGEFSDDDDGSGGDSGF